MKQIFILVYLTTSLSFFSQTGKIPLQEYSFSEIEKLQRIKPRPVLVFLYTDWCKICFAMKQTTFQNKQIIKDLNTKYYLVFLNGEEKKDITFLGTTFSYKPTGSSGIHELAKQLTLSKKNTSYPTSIILNTKNEIDVLLEGYLNSSNMHSVLNSYLKRN